MFHLYVWLMVIISVAIMIYAIVAGTSTVGYKRRDRTRGTVDDVRQDILRKLQEKQYREGKNDWVDVFEIGRRLGYSAGDVRNALSRFEADKENEIEISMEKYVRLGSHWADNPRNL